MEKRERMFEPTSKRKFYMCEKFAKFDVRNSCDAIKFDNVLPV